MNESYSIRKIIEKKIFVTIFLFSILVKALYFIYNKGLIGPDAAEYIKAAGIFEQFNFRYILSNSPYTFWRLPLFPFVIFITRDLDFLYLFQLLLTYYAAFIIFKIFVKLSFSYEISLYTALFSLFIPYFNIAAVSPGVELLQVVLLLYITKKLIYNQHDTYLVISLIFICFLRPESYLIVLFIIIRYLLSKSYKAAFISGLPLATVVIWMIRNLIIFGSFSLINPIMSGRAMIGSVYGVIYLESPHPFHKKYNYYEGFDYVNKSAFVKEYKAVVNHELWDYIINNPLKFIAHRIYSILKCFSYISLHGEHMPDKYWKIYTGNDRDLVIKNNSIWAYSSLISNKDYLRLFLRLSYHLVLVSGHIAGLIYIFINYKRFGVIIFIFATFSYLFIVEADMRYFIFPQLICLCFAFMLLIQLSGQKYLKIKTDE